MTKAELTLTVLGENYRLGLGFRVRVRVRVRVSGCADFLRTKRRRPLGIHPLPSTGTTKEKKLVWQVSFA